MAGERIENHPMLRVPISTAMARRLFPGTPAALFYEAAPHDGRGRFLALGQAFQIARDFHLPRREAAKRGRRSVFTRARFRAAKAAPLPGAVDHLVDTVNAELARLSALAADLGGQSEAARIAASAAAIRRQAERGRARLTAKVQIATGADHG